jgi:hypothetical protein
MNSANDYGDFEAGFRTYLRADSDVSTLVSARVFFDIPKNAYYPLITVSQMSLSEDDSDAPLDYVVLAVNCWGTITPSGVPNRALCRQMEIAVRRAISKIHTFSVIADDIKCSAQLVNSRYLPDPNDNRPRYAMMVLLTGIYVEGVTV